MQRIGSPILNMSIYQEAETHMLAILVKRTVLLINTRTHTTEWQKTYPDDFSGAVSDVTLSEECVFVTLKYAKEVVCHSRRSRFDGFKIDSMAAADLGIDYWSPLSVAFSRFHPRLLFVSTYDTVYVIDHGTDHVIRVLSNITNSKALSRPFFKVSLNSDFLVVLQLPNIIEEYSLSAVYKGSTPFLKTYPMYGYVLPPGFNVTFARFTDLLFVEAVEEQAGRSTILVFVPGRLAHAVLYDVINLPQRYDQLFMDTSGFLCNYVGIVANGKLSITRQFDYPILVLESILDHNFTLSLHSSPEQPHTFQV